MGGELSILRMIVQASLVVQIVIGILLAASLMSWAIIFRKRMWCGARSAMPIASRTVSGPAGT